MSKLLIALFVLAQVSSASHAIELTDKTIQSTIDDFPSVLIDFYASWCGHCKHFSPIYDAASIEASKRGLKTVLAKIDAYTYEEVKNKFDVEGYPTVFYFQYGNLKERYSGGRTVEDIINYLTAQEKSLD